MTLSALRALAAAAASALLAAWAAPAMAGDASLDTLEQRIKPCIVCHADSGSATADRYSPRIAGMPEGYLYNQLLDFREGRRRYPMMIYLTQLQRDAYLEEMAGYFAAQKLPYPAPAAPTASAAQLERGRLLATEGDPGLRVPACNACHGNRLLGVAPAVPGLLGISTDYLTAQMSAWLNNARVARAPDCMAVITHRMRREDVDAVAAWLAAQPVPADDRPDARFSHEPPLACGSVDRASDEDRNPTEPAYRQSTDLVARGADLVRLADCQSCHTRRGGAPFAGGRAIPTPFGTFYTPNITSDPRGGIGAWTASDLWNALHDGISKSGAPLYPAFPFTNYTQITRRDSDAIYAYLKTIAPSEQPDRAHELRFPFDNRILLYAWRALYFRPGVYQADTTKSVRWNRGAYLVNGVGHCSACHAARNALGATRSAPGSPGGRVLNWYAPSLADPAQGGVQAWSEPAVVQFLKTGTVRVNATNRPHAVAMGPMAEVVFDSLQYASDADLGAMAEYLRSLPMDQQATRSQATPSIRTTSTDELAYGAAIYERQCAQCHGEKGEGRAPAAAPLAGNREVLMASALNPVRIVLFGGYPPGTSGNPRPYGMPGYASILGDADIAEVLSYVRAAWGNNASPVSAREVAANRGDPLW